MSNDIDFTDKKTDIAIIGVSIRLPSVENVDQFWNFIKNGEEVIADLSGLNEETLQRNPDNSGQFIQTNSNIKDIEYFDTSFFNINPSEASWMDPQHRLFLELAWEALEAAGYAGDDRKDVTGVYAGVYANYYSMFHLLPYLKNAQAATNLQIQIASEKDHVATMAAYKLGLIGPSLNVQSACSSSLAAVHMACESLLTYSSDMMICGAATLSIPQIAGYEYQDNGLLSSDGHLRAFDAKATGTIYSDGAGCVVLKRFQDAWEDGDTIYGVIKGSAMNNDGSQKAGFTAPAVKGQIEVIERAMMVAGVQPEQISYLEAHGTGTPMGDAIELEALHEVFAKSTSKRAFCALGSNKSNFGHTGPAAGVIGLIKTMMALKDKILPPAINIETPNSRLASGTSPFYLNPIALDWSSDNSPRYAGVSSFGLGGTNVHVIVEEPPEATSSASERKSMLFVLSAKTKTALHGYKNRIQVSLSSTSDRRLADSAYTLQIGRKAFEHRGFFIASAKDSLSSLEESSFYTGRSKNILPPLHFCFPDLTEEGGSKDIGWVREEPLFYEDWAVIQQRVRQAVEFELVSLDVETRNDIISALGSFVVQITMSRLWHRWGISPSYYEGEGAGLYAAAAESGWLKLEDAAYLYTCYVLAQRFKTEKQEAWIDRYERRAARLNVGWPPDSLVLPEVLHEAQSMENHSGLSNLNLLSRFLYYSPQPLSRKGQPSGEINMTMGLIPSISGGDIQRAAHETRTETEDIWEKINNCLGWLWVEGFSINWSAYYEREKRLRIPLPTYPFERVRCWVEPESDQKRNLATKSAAEYVTSVPLKLSAEELVGYKAPRSGTERVLVHLWEKHLGVTPIGIEDNFYELGGNSLFAASLYANVNEVFNVDIELEVFLEHQSIAELADVIESFFKI
ncbi:hypothetical protein G8C92_05415 [Paenibacillus donghaensis]|uniref:type I polyketide synthase n=1 Tax=Paenibacillus donghaensis TaxID=414771 RepID=UPI0018839520|nr:polyketide synthase [Paenibacillus donghaensis]MBE9913465.1 hypothetical protein [Paenibacillus donghaensis]